MGWSENWYTQISCFTVLVSLSKQSILEGKPVYPISVSQQTNPPHTEEHAAVTLFTRCSKLLGTDGREIEGLKSSHHRAGILKKGHILR